MKAIGIGCVAFSYATIDHFARQPGIELAGIVTKRRSPFNADFRSLEPLAREHGVPCYLADDGDADALAGWMRGLGADVGLCTGWPALLRAGVLRSTARGIIGFHPTALPKNRGRHPIVWTLALGLPETAATFFFLDAGADSGDVIDQRTVPVSDDDDAATLYLKITATALVQLSAIARGLVAGTLTATPQDETQANVWRKRGAADGRIDWRMSARAVRNLVRALTHPYAGAHCVARGADVKIWKVEHAGSGCAHYEPGKVLVSAAGELVVQCGDGALSIVEHEFPLVPAPGSYLR